MPTPALCAAFGAALSYYFLFPGFRFGHVGLFALLAPFFVSVAAFCLFRAPASPPAFGAGRVSGAAPMLLAAFAAGAALGIGAGSSALSGAVFGIPNETVTGISGKLLDDPRRVSGGGSMVTLSLAAAFAGGATVSASGELTVFFREGDAGRLREFGRGAEVFAEGRLQKPSGAFRGFGAGGHVFGADSLHVTSAAGPLESFRTGIRLGLAERLTGDARGGNDAAWGGLALALLLGIRDGLDSGMVGLYRDAGISYILALSGMHLAVVIALVSFLLKKPLGVRPAAVAGAVVIAAYCFVVGPLPSLYRSAIMYALGVLAVLGMLRRDALSVLAMAFLVQLSVTPKAGFSLSFVLSYLAMVGILVLGKSLGEILRGWVPRFLLGPLALSLGAFIATAAVVSRVFGDLRPVGILAGLVVAPLTSVFMVASMAWLALDSLLPALSPILARPLSLLYDIMEGTARLAGLLPGVKTGNATVPFASLLLAALIVALDAKLRSRRNRLRPFP